MFSKFIGSLLILAVCADLSPVLAHAKLLQSNPAADTTLTAPKTIKLTFSEKIVPAFSGLSLKMSDGMVVSTSNSLSNDGKAPSSHGLLAPSWPESGPYPGTPQRQMTATRLKAPTPLP